MPTGGIVSFACSGRSSALSGSNRSRRTGLWRPPGRQHAEQPEPSSIRLRRYLITNQPYRLVPVRSCALLARRRAAACCGWGGPVGENSRQSALPGSILLTADPLDRTGGGDDLA